MNSKLLVGFVIAALAVTGMVIPFTNSAWANHSSLKVILINKVHNSEIGDEAPPGTSIGCLNIVDFVGEVGEDAEETNAKCSEVSGNGETSNSQSYSVNGNPIYIPKSQLSNNDDIKVALEDNFEGTYEEKDVYHYIVHDIDTIDEVQIRVCSGPIMEHLCENRIAVERDLD